MTIIYAGIYRPRESAFRSLDGIERPCLRSLFAMCWRENPGAYHAYINKRGRALALGVDVVPLRANAADPCPDWRSFFELVRHGVGDPGLRGTALDGAAGHREGLEQELRAWARVR